MRLFLRVLILIGLLLGHFVFSTALWANAVDVPNFVFYFAFFPAFATVMLPLAMCSEGGEFILGALVCNSVLWVASMYGLWYLLRWVVIPYWWGVASGEGAGGR